MRIDIVYKRMAHVHAVLVGPHEYVMLALAVAQLEEELGVARTLVDNLAQLFHYPIVEHPLVGDNRDGDTVYCPLLHRL